MVKHHSVASTHLYNQGMHYIEINACTLNFINMQWPIHSLSFLITSIMLRVLSRGKEKCHERRTLITGNTILAKKPTWQHAATTHGCRRTSKRSRRDQIVQTNTPLTKRTTHRTRSTTKEYQLTALTEADILRIVDTMKRGLSGFTAGTQVSDTL